MSDPKVSIVILNYNTAGLLEKLVPFALKTNYSNFEVVVADNASTDESCAVIEKHFPSVRLIRLDKNHGFAQGYNLALEQIHTPYAVLLNSDVEVDPNWLSPLIELMERHPDMGAIQPKILDYYKRDHFEYAGASGGFIDRFAYPFCRGRLMDTLEEDRGQHDAPMSVLWASGAAMLVRLEAYRQVGGLDADFFAHMEEIDLCWRMQNAGYYVVAGTEAKVYHMGGGTLDSMKPRKTYLNFRNNMALITKNLPFTDWVKIFVARLFLDGLAGVKFLLEGKPGHTWAIVKAHWSFFFMLPYWWRKRKHSNPMTPLRRLTGGVPKSLIYHYYARGVRDLETFFK